MLIFLLESNQELNKREDVLNFVWHETHVAKNVLNTHLFNLKNKLTYWNDDIRSIRFQGISLVKKIIMKLKNSVVKL